MSNIEKNLDLVKAKIQDSSFLNGEGLSNEENIRFFCYDPEDEMAVRNFIEKLKVDQTLKCNLKICNLYEMFLSICEEMEILDAIPDMEEEDGSDFLLSQLHSAIDNEQFIDKMQYEPHQVGDVIMLTQVGMVFPFARVHSLLEAMQPHFSNVPIVVMYPGKFDKYSSSLFGKLKPNNYYRAFYLIEED